jgi:hypothetical protein
MAINFPDSPTTNQISVIDGISYLWNGTYWTALNTSYTGLTASKALVTDVNGIITVAGTTSVQIGYLSTTTSDVQTQLNNKLSLSGGTLTGNLNIGGLVSVTAASANEGGQINLAVPTSGTLLSGDVALDVYQNSARIFGTYNATSKAFEFDFSKAGGTVLTSGNFNTVSGNQYLLISGGTLTGNLTINNDPSQVNKLQLNATTGYLYYNKDGYLGTYGTGSDWNINPTGLFSGNAATASTLAGNSTNWADYRSSAVANLLGWKNFGNGHVIFDASNGTSPSGTAVNADTPQIGWVSTYPTLMGWNGSQTFGVKVDRAERAKPLRSDGVTPIQFEWNDDGGYPTYLWGVRTDRYGAYQSTDYQVFPPSRLNVNYATNWGGGGDQEWYHVTTAVAYNTSNTRLPARDRSVSVYVRRIPSGQTWFWAVLPNDGTTLVDNTYWNFSLPRYFTSLWMIIAGSAGRSAATGTNLDVFSAGWASNQSATVQYNTNQTGGTAKCYVWGWGMS